MDSIIDIVNDVIRNRRSIFPVSYTGEEIPREVIKTILTNANFAPSHKFTQPWYFQVFRKKGLEGLANEMGRLYKTGTPADSYLQAKFDATRNKICSASCVIAIIMKTHPGKLPEWEELAAVACAVQNMWLTATALNVGAYWSTPASISKLDSFLRLEANEKCIGLFYMGYHRETARQAQRIPIAEKTKWVEE